MVGNRDHYAHEAPSYYEYVLDATILEDKCAPPDPYPQTGDSDDSFRWNYTCGSNEMRLSC
jgi:hypothetical protein